MWNQFYVLGHSISIYCNNLDKTGGWKLGKLAMYITAKAKVFRFEDLRVEIIAWCFSHFGTIIQS